MPPRPGMPGFNPMVSFGRYLSLSRCSFVTSFQLPPPMAGAPGFAPPSMAGFAPPNFSMPPHAMRPQMK